MSHPFFYCTGVGVGVGVGVVVCIGVEFLTDSVGRGAPRGAIPLLQFGLKALL